MKQIIYQKTHTYKYLLSQRYEIQLPDDFKKCKGDIIGFISIHNGKLAVGCGYRWDGPSGPTVDTKNFMRGSLIHDALYQLMREGRISRDLRKAADKLLRDHCREDGMNWFRAQWVYLGVRAGGKSSTEPEKVEILTAP